MRINEKEKNAHLRESWRGCALSEKPMLETEESLGGREPKGEHLRADGDVQLPDTSNPLSDHFV